MSNLDNLGWVLGNIRTLSEQELAEIWANCLNEERCRAEHYKKIAEGGAPKGEVRLASQLWWASVSDVLSLQIKAQTDRSIRLEPGPILVLEKLKRIGHDLSQGIVGPLVDDARSKGGGRPTGFTERRDIAHAIMYIQAVKRGEIQDPAFNQTVRYAFDVTKTTVQNWVKRAEHYCAGIDVPKSPKAIERKMRASGGRYSRIGRGAPSE